MGENSLELKEGRLVRADDSWQGGANEAKPGIIMRAHPKAGDVYRQEYYVPGGALDQARVMGTSATVRVPDGSARRALVTVEWSPVEPQLERKLYVRGIGEVEEKVIAMRSTVAPGLADTGADYSAFVRADCSEAASLPGVDSVVSMAV